MCLPYSSPRSYQTSLIHQRRSCSILRQPRLSNSLSPVRLINSLPSVRVSQIYTPISSFFSLPGFFYPEGTIVQVIEEDDGSGWVKVADGGGGPNSSGLVPASYIEIIEEAPVPPPVAVVAKKKAPPPPVPRGSKPKPTLGSGKFGTCHLSIILVVSTIQPP